MGIFDSYVSYVRFYRVISMNLPNFAQNSNESTVFHQSQQFSPDPDDPVLVIFFEEVQDDRFHFVQGPRRIRPEKNIRRFSSQSAKKNQTEQ